jgi:hypothetical protein
MGIEKLKQIINPADEAIERKNRVIYVRHLYNRA